jgi:hypothetical protein
MPPWRALLRPGAAKSRSPPRTPLAGSGPSYAILCDSGWCGGSRAGGTPTTATRHPPRPRDLLGLAEERERRRLADETALARARALWAALTAPERLERLAAALPGLPRFQKDLLAKWRARDPQLETLPTAFLDVFFPSPAEPTHAE